MIFRLYVSINQLQSKIKIMLTTYNMGETVRVFLWLAFSCIMTEPTFYPYTGKRWSPKPVFSHILRSVFQDDLWLFKIKISFCSSYKFYDYVTVPLFGLASSEV